LEAPVSEDVDFLQSVVHVLSETIRRETLGAAIRKSESWLRNVIATMQDAVVSIDRRKGPLVTPPVKSSNAKSTTSWRNGTRRNMTATSSPIAWLRYC
jgi:hypothetical protein